MPRAAKDEKPTAAVIAGGIAGAVEGFSTYPFEFAKTQAQFASKTGQASPGIIAIFRETLTTKGWLGLYSGCTALVAGNTVKAAVRFFSYDRFKTALSTEGKISGLGSLAAGMGAGIMESVIAVTPSETIKTKLIDDAKSATPRFRGLVHGTRQIVAEEGIGGVYRGLFPVTMRQMANSGVRFSSYTLFKSAVQNNVRPGAQLPAPVTFGLGALAGIVTVYCTMPLDVIKTRMQSLEARQNYRHSLHCASRIFREEGILRFWRGTTPRLGRLMLSGGITFTVYEKVITLIGGRSV